MSSPPLIGLPGRRTRGRQITDFPEILDDLELDLYFADYARGVLEAGGIPIHLPLDVDAAAVAGRLDGVLLTGGTDVNPDRYGAEPHRQLIAPEDERDDFEFALFAGALDQGIPVLGICRGVQLINVFQGGSLDQHVAAHSRFDVPVATTVHPVSFIEGSTLHALYGLSREVNSLHHQAVLEVGRGLSVTARADDGAIEGLEMGDDVVAVQWHPEMMDSRAHDPIFAWLVERASSR